VPRAIRRRPLCLAAGLTKGSFFHNFKSKEELALAAAGHFAAMADGLLALAPYRALHALKPLSRRHARADLFWLGTLNAIHFLMIVLSFPVRSRLAPRAQKKMATAKTTRRLTTTTLKSCSILYTPFFQLFGGPRASSIRCGFDAPFEHFPRLTPSILRYRSQAR
jgi:AcrR family transcriptional regulator